MKRALRPNALLHILALATLLAACNDGKDDKGSPGVGQSISGKNWTGFLYATDGSIRFQRGHDWDSVRARCSALLLAAERDIVAVTGLPPLYTDDRTRCPQMAAVQLPERDPMEYKTRLLEDHRVEVPVYRFAGRVLLRISVQAYNTPDDLAALASGLRSVLSRG